MSLKCSILRDFAAFDEITHRCPGDNA